jgi:hypothetical protein
MAGHRKGTRKQGAGRKGARKRKKNVQICRAVEAADSPRPRRAARRKKQVGDGELRDRTVDGRRRRYAANKNEINALRRERYASDPDWNARCRAAMQGERGHRSRLKTFYGITQADYAAMLARQNGVCGICRRPPVERRLAVDHCRVTGLIRGLLCNRCNLGLGHFEDGSARLRAGADYLEGALARAIANPAGTLYVPEDRPKNSKSGRPWGRDPLAGQPPLKPPPGARARPRPRRG